MKEIHVGVDTGGTFTDFVVWVRPPENEAGEQIYSFKILSTPDDPSRAIIRGLERILEKHSHPQAPLKPADLHFSHGSTVATNAVLESKGAKTAFVATQGFKDLLFLARQNRPNLYDLSAQRPASLLGLADTYEISERTNSQGAVLTSPSPTALKALAAQIEKGQYQSVAVCLLFSFLNPAHEEEIERHLQSLSSPPAISLSSKILPEFREFERAATTFVNAYVSPVMRNYLERLAQYLGHDNWAVFGSAGGGIRVDTARNEAVRTVLSGPAGGVTAAFYLGRQLGRHKLLTFDMGGTSTDVALIDQAIPFTTEGSVGDLPVGLPMISIHTVGAGGGSLGHIDAGGALQTGPESAGADPGPVCYGNGGSQPAVSDANLILGRLPKAQPLADGSRLDFAAAQRALEDLGQQAGLTASKAGLSAAEKAALGIVRIADTHMENALRHISLERGHDPRDFTLVSFGGAGGLHAAELANRLSISEVWIPAQASTFSALGMLCADFVRDFSVTVMLTAPSLAELEDGLQKLQESAASQIAAEIGGDALAAGQWSRSVDVRYLGQSFEITTNFHSDYTHDFAAQHKRLYGYTQDAPLQVVNLRLRFTLERPKPTFSKSQTEQNSEPQSSGPTKEKPIDDQKKTTGVEIIDASGRRHQGAMVTEVPATGLPGPALVVRPDTTVYIPLGWQAANEAGNLFLRRS